MKDLRKYFMTLAVFIITCTTVYSQIQISGKVSDSEGYPLPGVNVIVEGTTIGTVTDLDGLFTIYADVGQRLVISFVGMKTQLIEVIASKTTLDVTLLDDSMVLDEMIIVGYGTQRKESVVGAIATAKSDDIKQQGNISNLTDALTGAIPGVSVLSISGLPGGDLETNSRIYTPSEILIRGKTTWNNSNPLILVDGVERSMNEIDISEVENISVLKDASATAVFGVKGGNGVIIITTKRGREGKARFNVEAEVSYETPSKQIETGDMARSAYARNIAIERSRRFNPGAWNLYFADQEIDFFRNGQYPYAYQNLKWTDIAQKDFTQSKRVNMTVNGGTERVKYFASASYNHVGDIMNSEDVGQGYNPAYSYDRINIRTNFDFDITKSTKLTTNFAGMYGVSSSPSGNINEIFGSLSHQSGDIPIWRYEDGMYGSDNSLYSAYNSYFLINYNGLITSPRTTINTDYTLTQKLDFITQGLSLSGMLAYDNSFRNIGRMVNDSGHIRKVIDRDFYLHGGYYDYTTEMYILNGEPANMNDWTIYYEPTAGSEGFGWVKTPNSYGAEQVSLNNSDRTLYYQVKLDYSSIFADIHSVTALAMFSRQQNERGSNWPRKREDWVGRVTYDYDRRYLLEINGAYNGSEKFGPQYRFDFFPSLAAGWVISNERFMKDFNWLDDLKIRYSYGLVGNDNVITGSQWPYLTIWDIYNFNSEESTGYGWPTPYKGYTRYNEGNPGNPDLRWEKALKQNLGLELGLLRNKIRLTVDLFKEERNDMLLSASERSTNIPPLFGKEPPTANVGKSKSSGAEIDIMYRNSINDFNYWISTNWTVARSKIIFKESPELLYEYQRPEGKPVGQTFTGISSGFIESWDQLYYVTGAANNTHNGYLMPGDLIMIDFNSDGIYNSSDDNVPFGYPTYPQNNYGINLGGDYKGVDFSLRFVGGYNATRGIQTTLFYNDNLFAPTFLLNETWSPEYDNSNPNFPALALSSAKQYIPTGSFSQYDGSFFRLQSAQIGYSLPKKLVAPFKINNMKLYVNGRNLFLWTKMPNDGVGMDDPGRNYPTKKQINIGLNIQF